MEHLRRRINGTAVRTSSASERVLMHAFMREVPEFSSAVEEKFHSNTATVNIFLLLYRSKWKPAPQLLLPFGFISHNGNGKRLQCTIDYNFAVRWLQRNWELLRLSDF